MGMMSGMVAAPGAGVDSVKCGLISTLPAQVARTLRLVHGVVPACWMNPEGRTEASCSEAGGFDQIVGHEQVMSPYVVCSVVGG